MTKAYNRKSFQGSSWYRAIALRERIALLKTEGSTAAGFDADIAERRLKKWRSQTPLTKDDYFDKRLKADRIGEEEFRYLLGETIEAIQERSPKPPNWLTEIERAFSVENLCNLKIISPEKLPENRESSGFIYAIAPLINQGVDRLQKGIEALTREQADLPFAADKIKAIMFASLPERLVSSLNSTMVLELNVARLQGLLAGDTPKQRLLSFLERLQDQEVAIALLEEYPVLAQQLIIYIERWVTISLEFIQRLSTDWPAIRTTFSPDKDPGILVEINSGAGDLHRGGRSVSIASFSSGFQIVYKPRSLAVDQHFQELLIWINRRNPQLPFQTLKLLDRGTYGWVEFISTKTCQSPEEIQRFYQRQGGYLALLYALEATDFHSENLIASGENPVLIDLESLFQPRPKSDDRSPEKAALDDSVLRVGLLPQRLWEKADAVGVDLSGIGGAAGQLLPDRSPYLESPGSDDMRIARQQMKLSESQNRPSLNKAEVNVLEYTEDLIAGFTSIYQLLLKYRDELLGEGGILRRFESDEVRVVLRPTRTYALLLQESFHPDVLRNALDRDRLFDLLWVDVQNSSYLAKVIPSEQKDLWQGDIPIFATRPNSCHLWNSGDERIDNFFEQTGMAQVQRRLQQLSQQDLERQNWFIRASIATLAMELPGVGWTNYRGYNRTSIPPFPPLEGEVNLPVPQLIKAARAVGDRLELLALGDRISCNWIGLTLTSDRHWTLAPLGMSLYDGIPGIALFLAYLGEITRETRYSTLARSALKTLQNQIERHQSTLSLIGGFGGWGGIIYTLSHLGTLWRQPELLMQAEELVELLPKLIEKDEEFDIIGGAAGCIASLLSLYRCVGCDRILTTAIQCGDRLIAKAQPQNSGIGWISKQAVTKPLTGFSHGAAGIAWALEELAVITKEERFQIAANSAIMYESSLFSETAKNWPDLRLENTFTTTWCYGAPGIGLARLHSRDRQDNAEIRAEIYAAVNATIAEGFGLNYSLAHGDFGSLELLLKAAEIFDDRQLSARANCIAVKICESISQQGWLCGVPLGVETPGLMTGIAGIGYGLLRLASADRVPSVLVLAPPK